MYKYQTVLLSFSLLGLNNAAMADSSMSSAFYIGANTGITQSTSHATDLYTQPNWCNNGSNYQCNTDRRDNAWQVKAGYQITPHWAVEGSYTDLGHTNHSKVTNPTLPTFNAQLHQKTQAWTLAAVGKTPLTRNQKLQAYGKLGISRWSSKATYQDDAAYTGNTQAKRHGIDPMLGLGLEYQANPHWSGTLGIDHYVNQGERQQLLNWAVPQTLRTQKADTTAVMLGVAYHF